MAKQMNAEYWGVSSKTGKNVNKLFCRIAALAFDKIIRKGSDFKKNDLVMGEKLMGKVTV